MANILFLPDESDIHVSTACCVVKDDNLYWQNKQGNMIHVANFYFELTEVVRSDSEDRYAVEIFTKICERTCNIHSGYYSFAEFTRLDFFELDRHLVLAEGNRSLKYLYHFFQQQAAQLDDSDNFYINKLGDNVVETKHYYCMGSQLLPMGNNSCKIIIAENLKQKFRLDIDDLLTPQEAYYGMMKFFDIEHGKTDIMMVYSVIGCMRSVLEYSKIPPNFSLILTGDTQTKKTSGLILSNSIYNRLDTLKFNTIRVDSSVAYAEMMSDEFCDTCINFDDVFKNPNNSTEAEIKVRAMLREIADNSPRHTVRGRKQINAQLAVTSEYLIKNLSDLGRIWLIHFNESLDEKRLRECQDRILDIPTFMRDFISWVYTDFDEITQSIHQEWQKFAKILLNNKSRYRRLDIAEFIFQVVFDKILEYGLEIGAVSKEECHDLMKGFADRLRNCKQIQQMIMEKLEAEEASNGISFAKAFVDCIENDIFDLGEKGDRCFVHVVKGVKCIYIRSEYLTDTLNYQYDKSNSIKFYSKYFADKNLLYRNSVSNVVKYNGECYLAIRIDRLKLEVCSDDYKIDRLFYERRR